MIRIGGHSVVPMINLLNESAYSKRRSFIVMRPGCRS